MTVSLRTILVAAALGPALQGCRIRNPEDSAGTSPTPPPAAALVLASDTVSLATQLARLEGIASQALQDASDDDRRTHILQAEAITDRLLETRLPFAWMNDRYSVEARLRQLQAAADRIVAEMRRGELGQPVNDDLTELRDRVAALRQELQQGGGQAPPSVDSLIAGAAVKVPNPRPTAAKQDTT